MATPEELAKLYDSISAKQAEKGVKGEKSNAVRDHVRNIVAALKSRGQTTASQATLRNAVKELMGEDTKMDQSYFSTIITAMYETGKDKATGAVIVQIGQEKAPKVRTPRVKKEKAAAPAA